MHVFQAARLEALHVDRRVLRVEAVLLDDADQGIFQGMAAWRAAAIGDRLRIVPGRVLGLGIDGDRPAGRFALGLGEIDDLLKAQDGELAVELRRPFAGGVVGGPAEPLLQLGQGEVGDRPVIGVVFPVDDQRLQHRFRIAGIRQVDQIVGGPAAGSGGPGDLDAHAGHGALARRDLRIAFGDLGDVGVVAEPRIVPCHQDAILAEMQILLERIGAQRRRHVVGRQRLLRHEAGQAAMPDHQRRLPVQGEERLGAGGGLGHSRVAVIGAQHDQESNGDRTGSGARFFAPQMHGVFPPAKEWRADWGRQVALVWEDNDDCVTVGHPAQEPAALPRRFPEEDGKGSRQ